MKTKSNKKAEFNFCEITNNQLKSVAKTVRAVNHPFRIDILNYLGTEKPKTVSNLIIQFRMEQSVISQHLAILRGVNAVKTKREGKYMYYSVCLSFFEKLGMAISQLKQ